MQKPDLLTKVQSYIFQNNLFEKKHNILVGVSGGKDSMLLSYILNKLNYNIGIAHVNFQLRGDDSYEDELFVRAFAQNHKHEVFIKKADTLQYAADHKMSIQEAARAIRYQYFNTIANAHNYQKIATAHHMQDNVETLFINLLRGTGIKGLLGMPANFSRTVRPLLNISNEEIMNFIHEHNILYREDKSNEQDYYLRNRLRHILIPILNEIVTNSVQKINDSIQYIQAINNLYQRSLQKEISKNFEYRNNTIYIPIIKINKHPDRLLLLHELLQPLGFNITQIRDILDANHVGKQITNDHYMMVRDRKHYIIAHKTKEKTNYITINTWNDIVEFPLGILRFEILNIIPTQLNLGNNTALLDADKITMPLVMRRYQTGDYFYPLGLNKKKKISDFLINNKVSMHTKEKCWVLCSRDHIVWVIGYRIDHRFALTIHTKTVVKIKIQSNT